MPMELTLNAFSAVNLARAKRWHKGSIATWAPERWSNAAAGEMGECCNAVKKLNRLEDEMQQHAGDTAIPADLKSAHEKVCKEACDTIVYLNLLIQRLGRDPEAELRKCFNSISEREGFPERI